MATDDTLAHFGVKGMKWGQRKKATVTPSSDHAEVSSLKKKHISELSNADLKKVNNRRNLEQNYQKLNPKTVNRGRNIATAILATATTGVTIYNMVHSPAGKAAIKTGMNAIHKTKYLTGITKAITAG